MKISVLSSGIVSPYGIGSLPATERHELVSNAEGTRSHHVALVDRNAPEFVQWSQKARLRRASPISYYMIEAAHQALSAVPDLDLSRVGIVATFFLGCLVYSIRFYSQILRDGRRFGSPVLFPETVFNSPVSHVVSTLGIGGPVYSQVGDKSCWASGMRTAECWLRNGSADHVIVLGAEEFDPMALDALYSAELIANDVVIGEGAGAILLSSKSAEGDAITLQKVADGFGFSNKEGAVEAASSCLDQFPGETPLFSTASSWTHEVENKASAGRTVIRPEIVPCEAFTARAGWDTVSGINAMRKNNLESLVIPYWGMSQQTGAAYFTR